MIYNLIKNIFDNCELLEEFNVNLDYLDNLGNSVSIIPQNSYSVIKSYSDGEKIFGFEFDFIVRLKLNGGDNVRNYNFLDNFVDWIMTCEPEGDDVNDVYYPLQIRILEGPVLVDDNIHSGKYKIKCRLDCMHQNCIV